MKISWVLKDRYGSFANPDVFERIVSRIFEPIEAPEEAKVFILNIHGVEMDKEAIKRKVGSIEEPGLAIVLWANLPEWESSTISRLFGYSLPGGTRDCHLPVRIGRNTRDWRLPIKVRNEIALKDNAGTTFGLWDKDNRLALIFFDLGHSSSMFHKLVPAIMEKIIEAAFNPSKEQWKKITLATIDDPIRLAHIARIEAEIEDLQAALFHKYRNLYKEIAINKAGKKIISDAIEQLLKSDNVIDAYARPSGLYLDTKKGKFCLAISGDTVEALKEEKRERILFSSVSAEALAKLLAFGQYDTFVKLVLELL